MPSKGKTRVTDAQRRKIAAAKLAGKSRKRIAAEVGLADSTVSHQLADPRTVTLTLQLKHRNAPQIERMHGLMLDSLERDLKSRNKTVCAMARGQFLRLLPLGDPPLLRIAPSDAPGEFTLEELLSVMAAARVGAP